MHIPEVMIMEPHEASSFETELALEGLRAANLKFNVPFGHPVVLPKDMTNELHTASLDWWNAHTELIDRAGGITAWMADKAPTFTNKDGSVEPLNNPEVNSQLENRLKDDDGWNTPFMAYDCMLVKTPEGPQLNIIEAQSLACYAGWMEAISRARNDDRYKYDRQYKYDQFLETSPTDALGLMKNFFTGPITVLDMNHDASSSITHADKIVAAKVLGDRSAKPITPLQVKKVLGKWFSIDEKNHLTPITNVFSRLMQEDLDEMCSLADPDQLKLLKEFFNDPEINWLQHPTWQYLANKSTIPLVQQSEIKGEFQNHLVPTYGENEAILEPGRYILKPIGGNSGNGQKSVAVKEGESFVVPPNFIAQKRFVPAPIRLEKMGEHPSGLRNASLEVRVMYPPQPKNRPPNASFMTRLAPYFYGSRENKFTISQTNIGKIAGAMISYGINDRWEQSKMPFGIGPGLIDQRLT